MEPSPHTTPTPLNILLVEDRAEDAELMVHQLRQAGFLPQSRRVDNEPDFLTALEEAPDIILCDYSLPQFSGLRALELMQEHRQEIPFIIVSGSIGEDVAVEAMKNGADDYLLKDRLAKLGQAVRHALREKSVRDQLRTASEALRNSEEKYRTIVINSNAGIYRSTPEGVFLEANPALAWMLGYNSVDEFMRQPLSGYFTDRGDHALFQQELARTGLVENREIRLAKKDGTSIIGLLTAQAFRDEQGEVRWIDGVIQEITARAALHQETQRLKKQLEFLLGVTKTHLDIIDAGYNLRYVDPAWQKIYGDPAGKKCHAYFMGLDEPCPGCGIKRALHTQEVTTTEELLPRENNRPIQVTTIPFQDDTGEWLVAEVNVDMTERKKAESRLTAQNDLLTALINSAGETIIFSLDRNYRYTAFNEMHRREMKRVWNQDIQVGMNLLDLISQPTIQATAKASMDRALRGESFTEIQHQADKSLYYEFDWNPVRLSDGTIGGVIAFVWNITARKQMESQLQQAQKLESIGRLAAGIAHEINTPIQFVGDNLRFLKDSCTAFHPLWKVLPGFIEAAKTGILRAEAIQAVEGLINDADLPYCSIEIPRALDQSLEGIQRITRIVQAMKEFSHPVSDEMVLTNINKAIETTALVARNEWKYVAQLETQLDPSLPPVECLPGEINQVLLNLIVNAAQAIGEKFADTGELGKILITTHAQNGWLEIRVEDNGTGILEEHRDRMFDLFFTTKPVGKGTGQGLAMARNSIVKKHGGSLAFETTPGQGTTFIVQLPIRKNPHNEASP